MQVTLPMLAAAALLAACGQPNGARASLEGSLSAVLDMTYDQAFVETTATDVSVRFVRVRDAGEDMPFKVSAWTADLVLAPNASIDLAEPTASGQRGALSRTSQKDTKSTFPRISRGKLTLFQMPVSGKTVSGKFNITFEDGVDVASGRTVFANFSAKVP